MHELQQAVGAAFEKIVNAGVIEAAIEKKLTETVISIIDHELRSYSDFGKALEAHVKQAVNVDLGRLELPGYNDLILKLIQRQVATQLGNQLAAQIEKQMTELLAPPAAEIKLSELLKDFIETKASDCACDGPDAISLHVEKSSGGYAHIYFDEQEDCSKYSCKFAIHVDNDGKAYSVKIDEKDPKKQLFVGPFYSFERRLFQLYAAGTKLVIDGDDENDFDTAYPGRDY